MKAWPCEVVFGGLKSAAGGDYAAAASWAKLAVPLRAPIQGNNPTQTEVRILLTEHSCGRVWAGGIFHISLWYVIPWGSCEEHVQSPAISIRLPYLFCPCSSIFEFFHIVETKAARS